MRVPLRRVTVTSLIVVAVAVLLAACGGGDPAATPPPTSSQPVLTAPPPTVDPTEEAEDAVRDALQLYVETLMAAGLSEDWSEETLAQGMRGDALANWLEFGPVDPGDHEGEIVFSDLSILELTLDPITARVQLCYDTTGWLTQGQPGRANTTLATVVEEDGTPYVTEFTGQGTPCE